MNKVENFQNRTLKRATLPNGMRCCFVNDQNQEDVAFTLSIGGGTESEPAEYNGIAKFCLEVLFSGSATYPGTTNFKDFITDNEISCSSISSLPDVRFESNVPEFAFGEFLRRVLDALEYPELSPEGLEYTIEKRRSQFYNIMRNENIRLVQISTIVRSGDKYFGINTEGLFGKKNLQLLVEEYYSKYFKPSNMSLIMVSSLPLEQQYEYVLKSLGLLNGTFESPKISHPFECKRDCQDGELMLTKAFTMNPKAKMLISCHLPKETSVSSSLYLGYLFLKSDPGSLSYHLKNEGLVTGISVDHIYWKKSMQTLDIVIDQTEEGVEKIEEILSAFMAYLELIKTHDPSKELFDQSRQYFSNLREHETGINFVERIQAIIKFSESVGSSENHDDLLFPDVPRCFSPSDIAQTARSLRSSDILVISLNDKFVHTQMHPGTDLYLQFSSETIRISPCFDNLCPPKPGEISLSVENLLASTAETTITSIDPPLFVKSISSESRVALKLRIQAADFSIFPLSVRKVYASIIDHKLWLLSDGTTFSAKIKVEGDALIAEIKSNHAALACVFSVLVDYLEKPIEDGYSSLFLKMKDRELERLKSFLCGDKSVDQDQYGELFLNDTYNVHSMIAALQEVNLIEDLPRQVKGNVTLILCGKVDQSMISSLEPLLKRLMKPKTSSSRSSKSELDQVIDLFPHKTQSKEYLAEPVTIKTDKSYSVVMKSIDLGIFSYLKWCQAAMLAEILNTVVTSELKTRVNITATFNAQAIYTLGTIRLLVKASHQISGITLARILSECLRKCIRNYVDNPSSSAVTIARARCVNLLLTPKGDLECEISRIWEPIKHGLPVQEYFNCFQENLWRTDPNDMAAFCSKIISTDAITNAPSCLFLSALDIEASQNLLLNIEMPLLRLYQPMSSFSSYPTIEVVQDSDILIKRSHYQNMEGEKSWCASQLEEAVLASNALEVLVRTFGS